MQESFTVSMCGHKLCREAARGVILVAVRCALRSFITNLNLDMAMCWEHQPCNMQQLS